MKLNLCVLALFVSLFTSIQAATYPRSSPRSFYNATYQIDTHLRPLLSAHASVVHNVSIAPRWSNFDAPSPGTIVNVATEHDVLMTVQYCNAHGIPFFAQAGGNGWGNTFQLGQNGLTINLRGLNDIRFKSDLSEITFQGGAIIQEVVDAAYVAGARVPTGNCNCVGTLGAVLGGGVGRLMGLYGLGVDNLLSVNLVTAQGTAIKVDSHSNPDLWWALRGAGANFGIVTSATMKAYPVPKAQNGAWTGVLIYSETQIEQIVSAINNLELQPKMAVFLYYGTSGSPDYTPTVLVSPYYIGTTDEGKAAFSVLYDIGPLEDTTVWTPYNETNAGSDTFCIKGGRKPTHGAGLAKMDPSTWRSIWNEYVSFVKNPGTGDSIILLEAYSMQKARSLASSSSAYPFRHTVNFQAAALPWYENSTLDAEATAFASRVRDLWRGTDGLSRNSTYINFAFDDDQETVYGDSLPRLRFLKNVYDPLRRFHQFFPL